MTKSCQTWAKFFHRDFTDHHCPEGFIAPKASWLSEPHYSASIAAPWASLPGGHHGSASLITQRASLLRGLFGCFGTRRSKICFDHPSQPQAWSLNTISERLRCKSAADIKPPEIHLDLFSRARPRSDKS